MESAAGRKGTGRGGIVSFGGEEGGEGRVGVESTRQMTNCD